MRKCCVNQAFVCLRGFQAAVCTICTLEFTLTPPDKTSRKTEPNFKLNEIGTLWMRG